MLRGLGARGALMAMSLCCTVAWGQTSTADSGSAAAARRSAERCHARHASVDACDDAVRYNPKDPSLLIAMGDAQMRARRPSDAVRAYQRAALLAPANTAIQQRLAKAEAVVAKSKNSAAHAAVSASNGSKKFSNADPETQSH